MVDAITLVTFFVHLLVLFFSLAKSFSALFASFCANVLYFAIAASLVAASSAAATLSSISAMYSSAVTKVRLTFVLYLFFVILFKASSTACTASGVVDSSVMPSMFIVAGSVPVELDVPESPQPAISSTPASMPRHKIRLNILFIIWRSSPKSIFR